jgi:hypothetical protein
MFVQKQKIIVVIIVKNVFRAKIRASAVKSIQVCYE